eukprot:CAMPEP_0183370916 /NCGR_PEP_ID=MMETSP0164_2-20130417/103864_1 /TAXON_ID=221442 /ORGANISM="Coccolithus pelagicus ssp braarudi, Strain PLY182g" /LENGTH=314 /DNA_ID=CAMNT_0025547395 /DNA_START=101 /DNA_END=1046 /DNA_ORIENTATION=+
MKASPSESNLVVLHAISEMEEEATSNLPQVVFLGIDSILLHGTTSLGALRRLAVTTATSQPFKLVLSSSWQESTTSRLILDDALIKQGLPPCSDRTVTRGRVGDDNEPARARADEIYRWVRAHKDECAGGWIALDELDVGSSSSQAAVILAADHSVRIHPGEGLTKHNVAEAMKFLALQSAEAARHQEYSTGNKGTNLMRSVAKLVRWKKRLSPSKRPVGPPPTPFQSFVVDLQQEDDGGDDGDAGKRMGGDAGYKSATHREHIRMPMCRLRTCGAGFKVDVIDVASVSGRVAAATPVSVWTRVWLSFSVRTEV